MKALLTSLAVLFGLIGFSQDSLLENNIEKIVLQTEHEISSSGINGFILSVNPPKITKWKDGYIVSYIGSDQNSYIFFTDEHFKKTSSEIEIPEKIIYDIETSNGEIAMLTGEHRYKNSLISDFIYFTKINENGQVLIHNKIVGSKHINWPYSSEFYSVPDQKLRWTGTHYVAFFTVQHNWTKVLVIPDVHEADVIYFIEPSGEILHYVEWGTSHSFEERIAVRGSYIATIAQGDGYPRGIPVRIINTAKHEKKKLKTFKHDWNNKKIDHELVIEEKYYQTVYSLPSSSGNYVPFSIGDVHLTKDFATVLSFSTMEGQKYHDLAFARVLPQKEDNFEGLVYLTKTKNINEHSDRLIPLKNGNFLLLWKQFDGKKCAKNLKKLEEEIDDRLEIFTKHNLDQNMGAVINEKGEFITEPQSINNADWYYNTSSMEWATKWHTYINTYGRYTHSASELSHEDENYWIHHKPGAKQIDIYFYNE